MSVLPLLNDPQIGYVQAGLAIFLALTGTALLLRCLNAVRGTTMIFPWIWALTSLMLTTHLEIVSGVLDWDPESPTVVALRLAVSASTFCPAVALLGAKRPQDRVWQFAVFSLWVILAMPAAQSHFLGDPSYAGVQGFQSWFMLLILIVTLANSILTRYGLSAALYFTAQWCLLSGRMPLWRIETGTVGRLIGLGLAVLALGLVVAGIPRSRPAVGPLDRVWLDFRDWFGMFWALRLAERMNAISSKSGWGIQLGWNGFQMTPNVKNASSISPEVAHSAHQSFRALLRRFVSKQWMSQRINDDGSAGHIDMESARRE